MLDFIIQGPTRLTGEIEPSGAKNSALKQIAAALLTDQDVILDNLPRLRDVDNMLLILEKLGATVIWQTSHQVKINCRRVKNKEVDPVLGKAMRASIILAGPLLARFGKAILPTPGGDLIGKRPLDTHINGLAKLGVKTKFTDGRYIFSKTKPAGKTIFLDEMSVTATENLLLFAAALPQTTILRGVAAEPEIEDLSLLLEKMGGRISGAGTHTLIIRGQKKRFAAHHTILPDRIEAGTLACAIAASRGRGMIKNIILEHLENLLNKFEKIGIKFKFHPIKSTKSTFNLPNRTWGNLELFSAKKFNPVFIDTRPYPGFSTDLQAPIALLLTQAQGKSRIFETLFEGRFGYAKELNKMGAKINTQDKHNILIHGPSRLHSATIETTDIRAGATLVLAGIIAQGKTRVKNIEILERGYENFGVKLRSLGAKIEKRTNLE